MSGRPVVDRPARTPAAGARNVTIAIAAVTTIRIKSEGQRE